MSRRKDANLTTNTIFFGLISTYTYQFPDSHIFEPVKIGFFSVLIFGSLSDFDQTEPSCAPLNAHFHHLPSHVHANDGTVRLMRIDARFRKKMDNTPILIIGKANSESVT
jgi:hypothetical protein